MTGRAGAHGNAHFAQLKHLEKAPGNYWYCECRYCQAAFFNCESAEVQALQSVSTSTNVSVIDSIDSSSFYNGNGDGSPCNKFGDSVSRCDTRSGRKK
ncbi:hypothetical protein F443_20144 [Phytophthora nicotianae P1569]|uniref:Uncharacterized protein n=1 Tax=Phytophthora nicotianae P1569 TaxID=1317065 RepID=V9E215_PHYNI|nr:hypothetical protein F443_20144 [Phytophthora nicotianae P1569]